MRRLWKSRPWPIAVPNSKMPARRWKNWRFVHYPEEMFGEDVGELYDGESDPDETNNLYHNPDYDISETVVERLNAEYAKKKQDGGGAGGAEKGNGSGAGE